MPRARSEGQESGPEAAFAFAHRESSPRLHGHSLARCDGGVRDSGARDSGDASSCTAPSDAELCRAAGRACGAFATTDTCGRARTITSCGACRTSETCANGTCACQPETNAAMCQRLGASCGSKTANDNCGASRTVECGTCPSGKTCGGGGTPNACGCTAETDAQFCARQGRSCGGATGADNCGAARTVTSCGTCVAPNTCSAGQCSCASETNAQFCARLGATCGTLSGTDLCGQTRNVASCGTCSGSNTCGGGGSPNACGCTPQTDSQLCAARSKDCGSLSVTDNCGRTRSIACVTCSGTNTCGGGGATNVCGCAAETDAAFCTRVGAACGAVTSTDNCGRPRSVSNCGACASPKTCSGTNQCVCTPETDAAFCARVGKNCGTVTATDNCGGARTVASCGACSGFAECGGDGTLNVCGGRREPMRKVCGGGYCWENPLPVGTTLRAAATTPQGTNWVVGDAGTALHWNGTTWRGWFAIVNQPLTAVWAFSDSDVWAAGAGGTVLRFDGTSWSTVTSGTSATLRGMWGASDGTLWIVGDNGVVLRRAPGGAALVVQAVPTPNRLNAVYGLGTDLWIVGNGVILRNAAGTWSSTLSNLTLTGVWAASATDVWATSPSGVTRFTGAQWVESNSAAGNAIYGTSPTNVWVARSEAAYGVFRFDGIKWTGSTMFGDGFTESVLGLTGGAGGTMLAVGTGGLLMRYDGQTWWRQTRGTNTPRRRANSMRGLVAVGGELFATGQSLYPCSSLGGCENGLLLRWTGGALTEVLFGSRRFDAPSATATNNLWARNFLGEVARFDGATWSAVTSPGFAAIAPLSSTDAWGVNGNETRRFNGTTWSAVPNPVSGTGVSLRALAAAAPSHVWAAGTGGTLLFFDGTTWSAAASGVTYELVGLKTSGTSNALAWGSEGVLKYNGSTWTSVRTSGVASAWPESATTWWLANYTEVKRWDGSQFVDMVPWIAGTGIRFRDVGGENGTVWLLGEDGELLRR